MVFLNCYSGGHFASIKIKNLSEYSFVNTQTLTKSQARTNTEMIERVNVGHALETGSTTFRQSFRLKQTK